MMTDTERRASGHGIEVRVDGGRPRLQGYAATFDAPSVDLGGFTEVIRRGAFANSLAGSRDIMAFVEHDPGQIVARRSNGSLVLAEDRHGLHVVIHPIDTTVGDNLIKNVRAKLLDSMSFGFRVARDGERWDASSSPARRELLLVDLLEVSAVAMPAYQSTEIAARALAGWRSGARAPAGGSLLDERLARYAARRRHWLREELVRSDARSIAADTLVWQRALARQPRPRRLKDLLEWMNARLATRSGR